MNPILLEKSDSNSEGDEGAKCNRNPDEIKRELDKALKDGFHTFYGGSFLVIPYLLHLGIVEKINALRVEKQSGIPVEKAVLALLHLGIVGKAKLGAWYIENLKRVIRKKRALEERYKINLPFPQLNFDNVRSFIDLQEAIGKIEEEELNIVDYALNEFQSYLTASERRYNEFKNAKEKKRVLSHTQHRFTRSYQKKLKIALTPLFLNRRWDSRSVFLTLTLDPKKWTNRYEMWTHIKEEENRFLTGLFKKLGKRIPYISVVEAHKGKRSRGNPHLHFLFLGVSRLMDWREIRDLWGLGHIWINHTTEGKKIK